MGTYDKRAAQVVSTNLGGPGDRDLEDGRFKRAGISRLLTDDEVKDAVGKLKII